MTLEDLADLICANSASTVRRMEELHNRTYAQQLNLQNDMTDVRAGTDLKGDVSALMGDVSRLKGDVPTLKGDMGEVVADAQGCRLTWPR